MDSVKCVLLNLFNESLKGQLSRVINNNLDLVNKSTCEENGWTSYYEESPHVTLFYGLENLGKYKAEHLIKMKNWYTFNKFRENKLELPRVIIDTFDNEENRVLKINLSNCNLVSELSHYYSEFSSYSDPNNKFISYNPHLTFTYLKPDVTDEQLERLIEQFDLSKLTTFTPEKFTISGDNMTNLMEIKL